MSCDSVSKWKRFPCDNCGRAHYGQYVVEHYFEGKEIDFIWCGPDGIEKRCENGHRRDPCRPLECHQCWWDSRPVAAASPEGDTDGR